MYRSQPDTVRVQPADEIQIVERAPVNRPQAVGLVSDQILNSPARGLLIDACDPIAGDWASNTGGRLVRLQGTFAAPAVEWINWRDGIARIAAGAPVGVVSQALRSAGWSLPVVGGHPNATVGACVSTNVRNCRTSGAQDFGSYLTAIEYVDGEGIPGRAELEGRPAIARALIGGLGTVAAITAIETKIEAVNSAWTSITTTRCDSFATMIESFLQRDTTFHFVKFDHTARRGQLGRGVSIAARRAGIQELPESRRRNALESTESPANTPHWLATAPTRTRSITHLWRAVEFQSKPRTSTSLMPESQLHHHRWLGLRNHQLSFDFTLPLQSAELIIWLFEELEHAQCPPLWASAFATSASSLSYLQPVIDGINVTLTLDATHAELSSILDRADEAICQAGGFVLLNTDQRLRPDVVAAMFGDRELWQAQRIACDPAGRFVSDIDRRLFW